MPSPIFDYLDLHTMGAVKTIPPQNEAQLTNAYWNAYMKNPQKCAMRQPWPKCRPGEYEKITGWIVQSGCNAKVPTIACGR